MWTIVRNPRRRYRLEVQGSATALVFSRFEDALRVAAEAEHSRNVAIVQMLADGRELLRYVSPPGAVGMPRRGRGRSA